MDIALACITDVIFHSFFPDKLTNSSPGRFVQRSDVMRM